MTIKTYLKTFKQFIIQREGIMKATLTNINKDIGPNSLEILSYLRPIYEEGE